MRGVMARRHRQRAAGWAAALSLALLAAPTPAGASVQIGAQQVVVTATSARAVITRTPFRLEISDEAGRTVLSQVPGSGPGAAVVPPLPHLQFATASPPPPTLYAPLAFLVGSHSVVQVPTHQWEGNLASVVAGGVEYAARDVVSAQPAGSGARLELSTSDPSGRTLVVTIAPGPRGDSLRVSARPSPAAGVVAMSDSFTSGAGEAFRGFGGRHNALDQRGTQFYNWLQQENVSSGSLNALTAVTPGLGPDYLFPNGAHAAYYVQSSFVSSAGYGFLLDRDEISHWRMASDRADAWQVEVGAPGIDYLVAPGRGARAISSLTAITGRQPVPPDWAVGPAFDREVKFMGDPASDYAQEVAGDLRDIDRYGLPLDAYRIEGWQFLPKPVLLRFIQTLRTRGIHPMLYFRAFVGQDTIGTDDPAAYDEALANKYVATHADGSPYTWFTQFNALGAQIDFTNPAAVRWWQGRIRAALDLGADGFMQDFGEQVLGDMRFHDGSTGATMHNRLPLLYHRATYETVRQYEREHPGRELFYFTRAGYTGTPGSAGYEFGNFPGDETTDWTRSAGLASLTTDMLNRAVGGAYGFTADIGGYFDVGPYEATTKELFLRWAEWSALSPLFRLHGSVGAGVHAPWTYDAETVRLYNALSRLHRSAEPLILELWGEAARTGMPITRPLWLAYPGDARAAAQDQEWLLGPDVLVAPVVEPGAASRSVYFPRGCWRSPVTAQRVSGPRSLTVDAPLDALPYYFRCGTNPFGSAASTGSPGTSTAPVKRTSRRGAAAPATGAAGTGSGDLPFTGLALGGLALAGGMLALAGLALRRRLDRRSR